MIWQRVDRAPALAADELHLWRIELRAEAGELQRLERLLQDDERARAARFHFERDRRRFTVARARLRQILGGYLGQAPHEVEFAYGPRGKPSIAGAGLAFNLAHSHELALLGVVRAGELGVDLEEVRLDIDVEEVGRHYFAADERAALRALPEERRQLAFFQCWTRKEAYLKAIGEGLWQPLDSFTVRVDGPAALLDVRDLPGEAARWWMQAIDPGPGYAAAVALRTGGGAALRVLGFEQAAR